MTIFKIFGVFVFIVGFVIPYAVDKSVSVPAQMSLQILIYAAACWYLTREEDK